MSKTTTEDFFITIMAGIITFFLVTISPVLVGIIYFKKKAQRPKMKETLFQQCIKELVRMTIDFTVGFDKDGGCFIENVQEQEPYFFIDFVNQSTVYKYLGNEVRVNITTMDELLKYKPFIEDEK